jgi:hypothetical protein
MPEPPAISRRRVRAPMGEALAIAGPRVKPRESMAAVKLVANASVSMASLQGFSSL